MLWWKGDVGVGHAVEMADAGFERVAAIADDLDLRVGRALCRQEGRLRLDDQPKLGEIERVGKVEVAGGFPGQHLGIEHMPLFLRADRGAGLRPDVEHALGDEHLDGLAKHVAADAEVAGEIGFVRQAGAFGEIRR